MKMLHFGDEQERSELIESLHNLRANVDAQRICALSVWKGEETGVLRQEAYKTYYETKTFLESLDTYLVQLCDGTNVDPPK